MKLMARSEDPTSYHQNAIYSIHSVFKNLLLLHWAIGGHGAIVIVAAANSDTTVATGRGHIEHAETLLLWWTGNWGGCGHIATLLKIMHNTLQDKLEDLILTDFPI